MTRIRKLLSRAWTIIRRLSGDDAYERYLEHCRAVHGVDHTPMDRETYFRELTKHRWSGVKRCC